MASVQDIKIAEALLVLRLAYYVIVIVIVIFIQGIHSAYADFQWSPDNNSTQNIIQHIYIRKIYKHLQQFMNVMKRV